MSFFFTFIGVDGDGDGDAGNSILHNFALTTSTLLINY